MDETAFVAARKLVPGTEMCEVEQPEDICPDAKEVRMYHSMMADS